MRAAVFDRYGGPDVVGVTEVVEPTPKAGQVLLGVQAAAVTSADSRIRGARFPKGMAAAARLAFGIRRPRRRILGSAVAGVVEAVGPEVTDLAPGDLVAGMTGIRFGGHAERVAVAAEKLVRIPGGVSPDDAAAVLFGGTSALHFLRGSGRVTNGASVLVNGASGAIGTNAVQLATHLGASVTGVCSGTNADLVRRLGADHVLDHTLGELAATTERFDVVLDTVGNLSIATGRALLRDGGKLLLAVADLGQMLRARGDVVAGTAPERPADFAHLLGLVADGAITVVVDRTYDLADIAEAHRLVDTGRKVGNVLVHP